MQFSDLFNKWAIIALFIVALFGWVINLQEDNNVEDKIINHEEINETFSQLRTNLNDYRDQSQNQKGLFESETPTSGFGSILLYSIVSAGKVFNGMIIGTYNVIIRLPLVYLGFDPSIVAALSVMLIAAIILTLWILYKLG